MRTLSFISLLMVVISCGKAPEMTSEPPLPETLALSTQNMSQSEILNYKYNNNISINCSLTGTNSSPIDFYWGLPLSDKAYKVLSGYESTYVFKLAEPLEFKDEVHFTDKDLREYWMRSTPTVSIAYYKGDKDELRNGSVHQRDDYTIIRLNENIPTYLEADENEQLICKLQTVIATAYTDQWQIIVE